MIGIIVQARLGSTRLPKKMLLKFYNGNSILDLIILKLKATFSQYSIILATTTNPIDDVLVERAKEHGIEYFRGNEENVLERFILSAKHFRVEKIIRVCADNPFLDMKALKKLLRKCEKSDVDYISFQTKTQIPTIKTHFGFWAEAVKLSALEKANELTDKSLYREHVTNFIYTHPEFFTLKFLPIPDFLNGLKLRLTIDTESDFKTAQEIFKEIASVKNVDIKDVYKMAMSRPDWRVQMLNEIEQQQK